MHKQRVAVVLLAAFGCAGAVVLPWGHVPYIDGDIRGTDGPGGWMTIFAFAIAGLLMFLPGWKDPPDAGTRTFAGLLGLGVAAWAVYLIVKILKMSENIDYRVDNGLWVILVSGAALAVTSLARFSVSKRPF
jgi:hypothetical protein